MFTLIIVIGRSTVYSIPGFTKSELAEGAGGMCKRAFEDSGIRVTFCIVRNS
jgi:hypothetical protein